VNDFEDIEIETKTVYVTTWLNFEGLWVSVQQNKAMHGGKLYAIDQARVDAAVATTINAVKLGGSRVGEDDGIDRELVHKLRDLKIDEHSKPKRQLSDLSAAAVAKSKPARPDLPPKPTIDDSEFEVDDDQMSLDDYPKESDLQGLLKKVMFIIFDEERKKNTIFNVVYQLNRRIYKRCALDTN
jgi:hypothetical protein